MASNVGQSSYATLAWSYGTKALSHAWESGTQLAVNAKHFITKYPVVTVNIAAGTVVSLTVTAAAINYGLTDKIIAAILEAVPDALIHGTTVYLSANPSQKGACAQVAINVARLVQILDLTRLGTSTFPQNVNITDSLIHLGNTVSGVKNLFAIDQPQKKKEE